MNGFVLLHRKMVDWEWYTDINVKALFIHLILMANHSDQNWRGQVVKRGELVTSIGNLAAQNGMTVMQVRTALKKLQKTGDVTIKTTSKNTVIMVVKYDFYQAEQQTNNMPDNNLVTIEQQSSNNQITTNNNDNNVNNDNKVLKMYAQSDERSTPIASIILKDGTVYYVEEHQARMWKELFPDVNVEVELKKMQAWSDANPGKRKTARGVKAFIVNWLSREQKGAAQKTEVPKLPEWYSETVDSTAQDVSDEDIRELQRRLNA